MSKLSVSLTHCSSRAQVAVHDSDRVSETDADSHRHGIVL